MKFKFVVVYEQTPNNYAAYLPELPGCVSTGKNWDHIQEMIQEAVTFHLESMLEDGDPIPQGTMSLEDAMAHHCKPFTPEELATLPDADWPPTFAPIEVEVPSHHPIAAN